MKKHLDSMLSILEDLGDVLAVAERAGARLNAQLTVAREELSGQGELALAGGDGSEAAPLGYSMPGNCRDELLGLLDLLETAPNKKSRRVLIGQLRDAIATL